MENLEIKSKSQSLEVRTMDDLGRLGVMMSKSGFFSDSSEVAKCCVKILAGIELGIPAFSSMTGIHIIQGKPVIGSNLMAALIKKSKRYNYKIISLNKEVCELEFFENGVSMGPLVVFTIQKAIEANLANGKNSVTWSRYPENMLFARAISNGIKFYCADLFMGAPVYTADEFDCVTDENGVPVNDTNKKNNDKSEYIHHHEIKKDDKKQDVDEKEELHDGESSELSIKQDDADVDQTDVIKDILVNIGKSESLEDLKLIDFSKLKLIDGSNEKEINKNAIKNKRALINASLDGTRCLSN